MPTEQEIQLHLDRLNAASDYRKVAEKISQKAYNASTWKYAEESNWFFENGVERTLNEKGEWIHAPDSEAEN